MERGEKEREAGISCELRTVAPQPDKYLTPVLRQTYHFDPNWIF